MASELTPEGQVIPPFNITAPAPVISLKGFKWDTVDEVVQGFEKKPSDELEGPGAVEQTPLFAASLDAKVTAQEQPLQVGELPAPRLPLSPESLGAQLPGQLGLVPGLPAPPAPLFPLAQFQGAYAGNGFNLIFRPRPSDDATPFEQTPVGPNDNILELNLTTEQLTFGETIGDIPNRGLNINNQSDITLGGFPYLQTIQDVTNRETGKGDRTNPTGIHFEPGMWLNIPETTSPKNGPSVCRMASIPHGTTINAQALSPQQQATTLGGTPGGPTFEVLDTTPFPIGTTTPLNPNPFSLAMDASSTNSPRIPQTLTKFIEAGTINTDIIKNPNLVLQNAINGLNIKENITFEVSTGGPTETINGGGTANISFLAGTQELGATSAPDKPNAHAPFMRSRFWIETVAYDVIVPRFTKPCTVLLRPTMPRDATAPTPVFAVTAPAKLPSEAKTILIQGIQIQYSQTVFLNFAGLTWPHVSVATLVPKNPQPFTMTS
ncbi:unnamed protein product [Periconia digitata]|uniref:Uncharacterized protein n=1 Tax=Periconia digitata TaxID=1303443 RepID=A0A9W4XTB8_9PLEO|nr:unnamed protein product [Periconia digitata]